MLTGKRLLIIAGVLVLVLLGVGAGSYLYLKEPSIPDLGRPFVPASRLPKDIQDESIKKVASATAELRENPERISRWLEVAVYRKNADDLEGAEEIWVYLTSHWPDNPIPYNNLADLYQNYTNEPRRAEDYWRKLITLRPDHIPAYRNLHDLYRTKLADDPQAEAILREGLEKNPGILDLLIPLAIFERDRGKTDAALAHFEEAKKGADTQGNKQLAGLLQGEIDKLRRTSPQ